MQSPSVETWKQKALFSVRVLKPQLALSGVYRLSPSRVHARIILENVVRLCMESKVDLRGYWVFPAERMEVICILRTIHPIVINRTILKLYIVNSNQLTNLNVNTSKRKEGKQDRKQEEHRNTDASQIPIFNSVRRV